VTSPETIHRRVLLFHSDSTEANSVASALGAHRMTTTVCDDGEMALAVIYNDPPDLIAIHEKLEPNGGIALARMLKADNVFAHLPILLLVEADSRKSLLESGDYPFDDYINANAPPEDLVARATLSILRQHRQLDANPLTRLPGNNSIVRELEQRIEQSEAFATCYIDLDNFKAFNDRYGFSRGDEALQMTSRLVVNAVSVGSPRDYYIGHVGGDDYIYIVPIDRCETVTAQLVKNFDTVIQTLYDDDDRQRGSIASTNRKGEKETFPLMTISIAVVPNTDGRFTHRGQISTRAAELKKALKKKDGSNFMVDQRTD
jgi:diguanylate cyclase (GGDEF)-like protein